MSEEEKNSASESIRDAKGPAPTDVSSSETDDRTDEPTLPHGNEDRPPGQKATTNTTSRLHSPSQVEENLQRLGTCCEGETFRPTLLEAMESGQYDSTGNISTSAELGFAVEAVPARQDDVHPLSVEVCASTAPIMKNRLLYLCLLISVLMIVAVGVVVGLFHSESVASNSETAAPRAAPITPPPITPPPINCSSSNCTWLQVGTDLDGPNAYDFFGTAVSFSDDGTRFAVGARYHGQFGLSNRGLVQIYEEEGRNWKQIGSDLLGDSAYDSFGYSVSISGDGKRVAVGAPWYDDMIKGDSIGQTKVAEYEPGSWDWLGSPIIGETSVDESGKSISLSYDGNIVAIGASHNDGTKGGYSGHVRVYEFVSNVWTQMGEDIDGEATADLSGWSVSLSNDGHTVAIGAWQNDGANGDNSGHARVHKYEKGSWTKRGQDLDGEAEGDRCGWSVSLSADGNIVAVGADGNDNVNGENSGHVRVYEYNSITEMWSQLGDDIDGEAADDWSGSSVSLSSDGTVVAVGAYGNDGNGSGSGHVRIYRFDGDAWVQVGGDIDGESGGDNSGISLSLSSDGSRVAIGAKWNDGSGDRSGHVRVYELVAA